MPIPKIITRYDKSMACYQIVAPIVDRRYVYDNSEEDADTRILFRMSNGNVVKFYTENIPDWAKIILS